MMRIRAACASLTAIVLGVTMAACGGGSGSEKAPGENGLTTVSLAAIPAGQLAAIVVGQEQGIFEEHGIDLEISWVEPAALVPALLSGDADFSWVTAPGLLTARGNGVPIKSVTTASTAGDSPETFPTQVLIPADSAITSPEDLAGKRVATASLFQIPDLALMGWFLDHDLDPKSIELVEIPFPNMADALARGEVDAVIASEPFVSIATSTGGATPLLSTSEGLATDAPISVIAATEQFIGQNLDLVSDFNAAMEETMQYAADHEDEVRAAIPTFTELEPDLAEKILLAPFDTTDDAAAWDDWAELLVAVGAVDEKPESKEAFLAD